MSTSPVAAVTDVAAARQFRIDGGRIAARGVVPLTAARLGGHVVAEDAGGADEQAAELAGEVGVVGGRFPQSLERGDDQRPHARLERLVRVLVDDPPETAQGDDHRLPDRVVGLVAESVEELQQLHGRQPPREGGRPGVVDEVVALERAHRTEHLGIETAAQLFGVVDPEEAVAAGVDDDRPVGIGERRPARPRGVVEEHRAW